MKKGILALLLFSTINAFAKENEIKVKSSIKEVTVFLSGASIISQGSSMLHSGSNELIFENLSPNIDPNSIQAKGEGNFTILSVSFRTNYLNNQPKSKEIKALEDSLETIQLKIELQKNIRLVYETEESFLITNKNIGGANNGVNAGELEKIAAILRNRLTEIKSKTLESKMKEKKLNEELIKIQNQLSEHNARRNKNTGEIIVAVMAKAPGDAKISLVYNVSNAGWSPVYDIRASDNQSPVNLEYRANVFQNTGVDWKDVKLVLSTGNPSLNGTKPSLNPWWLSFYNPNDYQKGNNTKTSPAMAPESQKSSSSEIEGKSEESIATMDADYAWNYTEVSETQTNILYEINIPYDIASDSKPHAVSVQTYRVPAIYKYYCVPKFDSDAFLLAKIIGWDQYNLISGEANIFFEGTFVGKSYLNTNSTIDTLDISLGRDKNIVISREMLKNFSEKKIIGLNKKESKGFEISVRNKKKQEIEIDIEDQIPLTTSNEIEIELLESSGAIYDQSSGKLTWNIKLPAAEAKKFKFGYAVKYPKDKKISNL